MIVCVELNGTQFLLDATDKFRPFNVLPERALNGEGLMVNEFGGEWVNLSSNKEMNAKWFLQTSLLDDEEEEISGKVSLIFRSSAASDLRESILDEQEKAESEGEDEEEEEEEDEDSDKNAVDDYKTGEVENLEVDGLKDYREDLKLTYDFSDNENFTFV